MAKTIAIFSTKGGVGKTFIAMNLAVSLGYFSGKKVALIDLDLQALGDTLKLLDVSASKSMLDLADNLEKNPQGVSVRDYMVNIEKFKIDCLPAVLTMKQAARMNSNKIRMALKFLESQYEYIIVDAGRAFTESLFTVFNHANLILLTVTPDVISVYQTKWSLDTLQSLHMPLNMVKLVINRAESVGGVSWQEIRAAIPCEIISRIPSEGKSVVLALNRRIPLVIDSPNSKVSLSIRQLSADLLERTELYLEHQDINPATLTEAQLLAEEGAFWKKFKLDEELPELEEKKDKDEITELKKRIHQKLIEKLDLKHLEIDMGDPSKAKQIREKTEGIISTSLAEETGVFLSSFDVRKRLVKEIADEALGLGPLEDLISDPGISDILVNNKNQIYVEREGKLELSTKRFLSNEQVRQIIERIIAPLGRRIDELVPMVDARLPDGSRVNAIIPPLVLTGPTLTIRKFGRERLTIDDLLKLNSLTKPMSDFLEAAVRVRKNIIVSGGTGSGKTTVLNVLSTFIPANERIISIEDAAELKLKQEHWVRLEARPSNIEGKGEISIRDLFRNSLRMRPDRVLIGECRGEESLDMLQAMNTGHDGSLTTIHANSPADVLTRLDSMILMSGVELPIRAIREMVASAINLIIHTARLSDGTRKITQITEVMGLKDETHINLKDIFIFKATGMDDKGKIIGSYRATGNTPSFMEEIKIRGISLSEDLFKAPPQ
ncbi:MAG: ATPase, T2SS/T4P/T4SS family [Candidatus Omnitrophica bacterium]|nr:ATPase, T2SS/T4P/T4SS family [Candidatus Omnitrophota bacterium]MDD5653592.1 ATPase, T2SS/T4P/T4SS family [Candidatus Omnitrophota bacterium]